MGNGNAYLAECCEDRREGAFRIGDLIVLDISVAVAADFLQNDVSKETKSYPLRKSNSICIVQNEISTFLRAVQRPG